MLRTTSLIINWKSPLKSNDEYNKKGAQITTICKQIGGSYAWGDKDLKHLRCSFNLYFEITSKS